VRKVGRFWVLAAAALATPGIVTAQDESGGRALEEVVVTAQRRAESLQDVPLAVSTLSADDLTNSGVNVVQNLSRLTPGLEVNRYAQFVSLFLRGVGTRYANLGLEPTVGLYFDDLYSARSTVGVLDFVDIDHVEVLKGPQGTLYGRNTTAGAIRIITKDPTDQFEGSAAATFGRYERKRFDGVLNVPLSPTLSSRFAVTYDTDDGYVRTTAPGMPRLEDKQSFIGTGKLLWTPTEDLSIKLAGSIGRKRDRAGMAFINLFDDVRQTGVAVGGTPTDDFYTSTQNFAHRDRLGRMLTKANSLELRADLDLGGVVLSSISGYRYFWLFRFWCG
jgi:iron complex outermembrane receptor protein